MPLPEILRAGAWACKCIERSSSHSIYAASAHFDSLVAGGAFCANETETSQHSSASNNKTWRQGTSSRFLAYSPGGREAIANLVPRRSTTDGSLRERKA